MRHNGSITGIILFLLYFTAPVANAQVYSANEKEQLGFYADVMYNAVGAEHRAWAAGNFQEGLEKAAKDWGVSGLAGFQWAQVQIPVDSSFALVTWQFEDANRKFHPQGFLLKSDGELTRLHAGTQIWDDPDYLQLSAAEWPSAVYYKMYPFEFEGSTLYLLFGYHGWDSESRLRMLEILDLRSGTPMFGAPVFQIRDDVVRPDRKYRKVLKYASQSDVRIVMDDSLGMVMMDHLIPARTPEGKFSYVPDGSYEAFQLEGGIWHFVEKVFDQTQDEPPGAPRPEVEKRDIFGRKID